MTRAEPPVGGLCAGRPEWTSHDRDTLAEAAAACRRCPLLDPCRDYANRFRWTGVAIAGWRAPGVHPAFPPTATPVTGVLAERARVVADALVATLHRHGGQAPGAACRAAAADALGRVPYASEMSAARKIARIGGIGERPWHFVGEAP